MAAVITPLSTTDGTGDPVMPDALFRIDEEWSAANAPAIRIIGPDEWEFIIDEDDAYRWRTYKPLLDKLNYLERMKAPLNHS
jgi:hypothetical protein